jgi:hypothetical protein
MAGLQNPMRNPIVSVLLAQDHAVQFSLAATRRSRAELHWLAVEMRRATMILAHGENDSPILEPVRGEASFPEAGTGRANGWKMLESEFGSAGAGPTEKDRLGSWTDFSIVALMTQGGSRV